MFLDESEVEEWYNKPTSEIVSVIGLDLLMVSFGIFTLVFLDSFIAGVLGSLLILFFSLHIFVHLGCRVEAVRRYEDYRK